MSTRIFGQNPLIWPNQNTKEFGNFTLSVYLKRKKIISESDQISGSTFESSGNTGGKDFQKREEEPIGEKRLKRHL